jgi:Transcription initiation factor TFIID component TAF4 family
MQKAEMEELRQREANLTALTAIGPRKKPKLDMNGAALSALGQVQILTFIIASSSSILLKCQYSVSLTELTYFSVFPQA